VAFVGIFVEDTEDRAREFVNAYKVSFPHGYDWALALAKPTGFRGMPYTVVFSQKGLEAKRFAGPVSKTDLVNVIETLLKREK
jgi:hypothetical protein